MAALAAIGLGASIGPRRPRLELALRQLNADPDLDLIRCSRWVRTPPLRGGTARGWFLNGVALFQVRCTAHELLDKCIALEHRAGRRRARFWGDRTLDLDVLMVEGIQIADDRLTLPHPAISKRPFVSEPLREVWPEIAPIAVLGALPRPVIVGAVARGRPPAYLAIHRTAGRWQGSPNEPRSLSWSAP